MLPIYVSYFAGGSERNLKRIIKNALGFILGFTVVFVLLGALAGTFGRLLREHQVIVNIITGLIVIFFGLNFLGVFKLTLFKGTKGAKTDNLGFFSSVLFGIVFSIGWTPCVGAFLGSALMLATSQGNMLEGVVMLLLYSLGLDPVFRQRDSHRPAEGRIHLHQKALPGHQHRQRRFPRGHRRVDGDRAVRPVPGAAVLGG